MRIENSIRIVDIIRIMKIVINRCYGGFGLSEKAVMRYAELAGMTLYPEKTVFGYTQYYKVPKQEFDKIKSENPKAYKVHDSLMFFESSIDRNDPLLVQVVEELGIEADGDCAELKVVEIPDIWWEIEEYDGMEKVVEQHRSWS